MALANSACVAFDTSWNLLAFGFNGKDYNAGTQDTWASGTSTALWEEAKRLTCCIGNAQDITTSGRP
jgi:hypothetical protein